MAPRFALFACLILSAACGGAPGTSAATVPPPPREATVEQPEAAVDDPAFAEGNAALADGRLMDALLAYDAVLARNPDHVGARVNRSIVHLALGDIGDAVDDARAATIADPANVDAGAHLLVVLARAGRCTLARETAAQLSPPLRSDAERALAICDLRSGEPAVAAARIDELLVAVPDDADLLTLRGVAAEESQNHVEALAFYNRALAQAPEHLDALRNKGMLMARIGRTDDAVATLSRWLELAPASAIDRPVVEGVLDTLSR